MRSLTFTWIGGVTGAAYPFTFAEDCSGDRYTRLDDDVYVGYQISRRGCIDVPEQDSTSSESVVMLETRHGDIVFRRDGVTPLTARINRSGVPASVPFGEPVRVGPQRWTVSAPEASPSTPDTVDTTNAQFTIDVSEGITVDSPRVLPTAYVLGGSSRRMVTTACDDGLQLMRLDFNLGRNSLCVRVSAADFEHAETRLVIKSGRTYHVFGG